MSSSVKTLVPALKGIEEIGKDMPAVRLTTQKTVSISEKSKVSKFEIVDSFGKPITGTKNVKVSAIDLSDNKAAVKDITTQTKLDNSVISWNIPADVSIGRYQLLFNIDGFTLKSSVITVTDKI